MQPAPAIPHASPTVSVNRVRLVDLPGFPVDAGVRGQQAYHLLSTLAVTRYAQAQAAALELPAQLRDAPPDSPEVRRELPRYVDACLSSPDPAVQAAAESIARRLGRNLGYILLTLHRGDAVNRAARADWTDAEWAHWATVRQVWLGGGVLSGDLGARTVAAARALLAEAGLGETLQVALSPYPRDMALVGAARYLPPDVSTALCCDFGHTSVKCGVVQLTDGNITALTPLATRHTPWNWQNRPDAAVGIEPAFVRDYIAATLAEAATEADIRLEEVMLSIAAYVRGGELIGNGVYTPLRALGPDARPLLAEAVAVRAGARPNISLIHDGTAAAALHAGSAHSAVLSVGTAIGIGFPPEEAGLRQIKIARY